MEESFLRLGPCFPASYSKFTKTWSAPCFLLQTGRPTRRPAASSSSASGRGRTIPRRRQPVAFTRRANSIKMYSPFNHLANKLGPPLASSSAHTTRAAECAFQLHPPPCMLQRIPAKAAAAGAQMATAVDYLHGIGIAHRDLKACPPPQPPRPDFYCPSPRFSRCATATGAV